MDSIPTHKTLWNESSPRNAQFLNHRKNRDVIGMVKVGAITHTMKTGPRPVRYGGVPLAAPNSRADAPGKTSAAPMLLATAHITISFNLITKIGFM